MNGFTDGVFSLACIGALCVSVPANALVITLADTVAADPDIAITESPVATYTFEHNFVDDGFVVGTDVFTSAGLTIRLTDTTSNENSSVSVGGGVQTVLGGNVDNNSVNLSLPAGTVVTFSLNPAALADLNADGKLSVKVSSTSNDFFFADSTLSGQITRVASVPEPLPLALMALGFMGLSAARRRSTQE
ncbi:MAG: secreted protein containing bacterial domain [Herminiimonas sp.]|nr:secreted protein containing bacterial domain [Herminiimonas sp.]